MGQISESCPLCLTVWGGRTLSFGSTSKEASPNTRPSVLNSNLSRTIPE
jgi:hypothetical protein